MLFLSKAFASNRMDLEPVFRWFKERLRFLDLSVRNPLGTRFTLRKLREEASHGPIVELLRHADLGVTDAHIIDDRPPEEEIAKMLASVPSELRERMLKERWLKPELAPTGCLIWSVRGWTS